MADSTISDLTAVTDLLTTDDYVLMRSGVTKRITGDDLASEILALAVGGSNELAYQEKTTDTSITATSEATANTVATAGAVVLDGSTKILVECFSPEVTNSAAIAVVIYGALNGGAAASIGFGSSSGATAIWKFERYLTPAAGSWVYSFRAWVGSGTGTIRGGAGGTGNYLPSFIRVSSA